MTLFTAKDFVETAEGLRFAVVDSRLEEGRVLSFLRYIKDCDVWCKCSTESANAHLREHHPLYLHYSKVLDAHLHAVPVDRVVGHYRPQARLLDIMQSDEGDAVERDALQLVMLLGRQGLDRQGFGVTGSLLLGVQNHHSDIDLVCYGREIFHRCRTAVRELIGLGELQPLTEADWRESFRRRNCSLTYNEYVWHEQRKFNKALVNGRKFDLSLIEMDPNSAPGTYRKIGPQTLRCRVVDDSQGFSYPAVFGIDHDSIEAIVSFTATYTGQAFAGERIEVSGMLEESEAGLRRIIVGSSREAPGEHIKVIDD